MKIKKIIYWISTGLLSAQMIFSAYMYIANYEYVESAFQNFGYPTYLIYPLATLKILGVIAIISKISLALKEAAYVGYFFNFTMAFMAHVSVGDGQQFGALIALAFLITSYITDKMVFGKVQQRIER